MMILLYLFALIALAVATAALYMAMFAPFPAEWLYYQYFIRKPLAWTILLVSGAWVGWTTSRTGIFPLGSLIPLLLMGLAVILAYRMHQEVVFQAVDFPALAEDPYSLPLQDAMQLAIIEYGGATKAYPLDYVVHHHIVNDRFGDRIVSLTYCAMCRSVIPFDVTDIGPLFVASFKHGNMIVGDRKTKTFFQQATFQSIIGPLHPHTLTMLPFQILPWSAVKALQPLPAVAQVTANDLGEFALPIPGVWRKIMASEVTPGLPAKERDRTFPARTHVIGVIDNIADPSVVYLKEEVQKAGVVCNEKLALFLVAVGKTVNGFRSQVNGQPLHVTLQGEQTLTDTTSDTVWDLRGKYVRGALAQDLEPVAISDEYWFSWQKFHPGSKLVRVG
ncbi:MAG TPA: DUF3179 domain-containing (seleno)protein [Caldilineaceae bacterium]|nr:DUF3179 domain-containing (seleno)protein [Caldilineaceae bacterium]